MSLILLKNNEKIHRIKTHFRGSLKATLTVSVRGEDRLPGPLVYLDK